MPDRSLRKRLEENEQRYHSLFFHNPDGVYSMDRNGHLTNINQALENILGYSLEELSSMSYHYVVDPHFMELTNRKFQKALEGEPQNYETVAIHKTGVKVPLKITNIPIIINKEVVGVFGIAKDASIEKGAIGLLEENEEKYRSLFENNHDAVFELDLDGVYKDGNPMTEKLTGFTREELFGRSIFFLIADDVEAAREDFFIARQGKPVHVERKIRNKQGTLVELEINAVPIRKQGEIIGIFALARDITEKKRNMKKMRELAFIDQLTGLPNRHWFYKVIPGILEEAKAKKETIAILSIDFDGFKYVNDTLGHNAGDLFLKRSSNRLRNCLRKEAKVSRVGGDEFLIILEGVSKDDVIQLSKQILQEMSCPFFLFDHEIVVTLSIGINMVEDFTGDVETVISQADMALMLAKREGKNSYRFFTKELSEQVKRKSQIENALRKAIGQDEFKLCYQPQINIQNGKLVGMEALLRWRPSFGSVSPSEFIPLAEDTGLILPIGEWVLKEACRQIKKWETQEVPSVRVSVNVSARQFKDPEFILKVKRIIEEENVDPRHLEIEITESVMMDVKGASQLIKELKGIGVLIAIDDFGTGYSSLNLISAIEFDTLKIDKSLIDDVNNNRKMSILKAIIDMREGLDVEVVIEGIETKEQADLLKESGIIAQGFYFSYPLSPEQLNNGWAKEWE